ncbi:hypothetical protein Pmani_033637 [Petrolisthes manimaculis]|uniref:Uncharacterized protein n=1 Tax=Petrolisthes manimaculis TaxID=1843537 RepID=A0AAE1TQ75_9EUCA|nr:hypothetical protein Pmani_033637 [Petrolisthes manimaculis]
MPERDCYEERVKGPRVGRKCQVEQCQIQCQVNSVRWRVESVRSVKRRVSRGECQEESVRSVKRRVSGGESQECQEESVSGGECQEERVRKRV